MSGSHWSVIMKSASILLVLVGFIALIGTAIFSRMNPPISIVDEMYNTAKGLKVVVSSLKMELSREILELHGLWGFLFFFGAGIVVELLRRLRIVEERVKTLEKIIDNGAAP